MEALAEVERIAGIDRGAPCHAPLPRRRPAPARAYPPAAEVATFWGRCGPLGSVPELAEAWAARKIDVGHVEDRDLARALPFGVDVPRWAFGAGQRWSKGPYRLIVPLYDSAGRRVSLHARAAVAPEDMPKGLSPMGCLITGLVMADPLARLMLAGAPCGDGEPCSEVVRRVGVVVTEGGPDFLTYATCWDDSWEDVPAVFGVIAGSWSQAIAARLPSGTRVTIATHNDPAGDKYAEAIARTLSHCAMGRLELKEAT